MAGDLYNSSDPALVAERLQAQQLCQSLNALSPHASCRDKAKLLHALFGAEVDVAITPPFFCDYGYNISFGRKVYLNYSCTILDVVPVTIGDHVLMGPAVHIYTALHPMDAEQRRSGLEYGRPVYIGADVWLGGGVIVCPGVRIGDGAVIGAGSVVLRDIPTGVFAAGNPCRVIRKLEYANNQGAQ